MDNNIKLLLTSKKRLSHDEEKKIFDYYHSLEPGEDKIECRNAIVIKNMGLIKQAAYKLDYTGNNYEDLLNEAYFGMLIAIEKYDPDRETKFSTYAWNWLYQTITRYLSQNDNLIRKPVHFQEKVNKLRQAERKYNQLYGSYDYTAADLAKLTDLSEEEINNILKINYEMTPCSLNSIIGESEHGEITELLDFITDSNQSVELDCLKQLSYDELYEILHNHLNPKEYEILSLRYGLDNNDPHTLAEVGEIYHITRERVRQIENKAIEKIQNCRDFYKLQEYEDMYY